MKKFFAMLLFVAGMLTTAVANAEVQTYTGEGEYLMSGILKIVDVQFKREIINDNTTRIRATVTANIDSDDINKWLAKSSQERSTLVAQNEELRRAIDDLSKIIKINPNYARTYFYRGLCYQQLDYKG